MKAEFFTNNRSMSLHRARIDAAVASAYSITEKELELILKDFPLLDRGQPTLPMEVQSTITRDLVLSTYCTGVRKTLYAARVRQARKLGAKAYILSEMKKLT